MLISQRFRFVYLANPKTGTTAIERAFTKYADFKSTNPTAKHMSYREALETFPVQMEAYEVVVAVRDPLETLHSWYRYRSRDNIKWPNNSTQGISFSEFFESWTQDKPPHYARVGTSVDVLLDEHGNVPADLTVFPYSGEPSLHKYLQRLVGEKVPDERVNESPEAPTQFHAELREQVDMAHPKIARAYEIYNSLSYPQVTSAAASA
ncbi:hypothetical protein [Microbaculum marinum]|uniref:Sulfotransferase family protein n=1 Tax=Microbaculum marinum TaxID=1764581 RepID=A0AAW9RII7_9HYPH